ncbi:response regulator transcription factor [Actinoplanes derwentensis]|uniref:DNA-binding response regulator, NarL/FixJ family, contains REC and HTH domains n=1 Tax=Actinoplanes derwentensis TaxID=113562 RepID=A0A1H1TQC9_9ACTN|nr:response regulator transcription factor [Actinoplanes derwentensis]GID85102.1 DNA-binding response regulator [Actinoplanes derwentensis]SDS62354.1 DNA-binding response regulator, NarL/FixJ family, contains REC and HTH domains [Actinoplanes derwentensis]
MIRVVVVDDEALVRSAFTLILNTAPDIEVVAATTGTQAVATIRALRPHVVLLDIRMPGVDGLTVLRQIQARDETETASESVTEPDRPVVAMLTTFDADEYVLTALHSGAAGFLLKDTDPESLAQLVRTLNAGGVVMSPSVARRIEGSLPRTDPGRLGDLPDSDRRLLDLIAGGLTNGEIADRLGDTPAGIREQVSVLLATLRVSTRVQAALLVQGTRR